MKTRMDKFKLHIKYNKKVLIFLIVLGIVALATGSIFSIMLNNSDKDLVSNYIREFLNNINNNTVNSIDALKNGLLSSCFYVLIIWIMGISVIGILITLFMYFSKLFILGFSVSSIISSYGIKGCLIAFSYIFPHQIINVIVYTILTMYAIKVSSKIIYAVLKKEKMDFKVIMNRYLVILLISLGLTIITTLFEIFITPRLIKFVLPLIMS